MCVCVCVCVCVPACMHVCKIKLLMFTRYYVYSYSLVVVTQIFSICLHLLPQPCKAPLPGQCGVHHPLTANTPRAGVPAS